MSLVSIIFLVLVLMLMGRIARLCFRLFGKLIGIAFSIFGYLLLGVFGVGFLGFAAVAVPVMIVAGIIALLKGLAS